MKQKSFIAVLLLIVAGLQNANAQKVTLHMSDNQTFEYNISQVDSITFAGDETKEIGIVIYGTENPMNTSFDIPADIQSNILVAYYGYPNEAGKYDEVEFPTYEDGIGHVNYIRTDEVLTRMDWEMISLTGVEGQIEQKARVPIYNVEGYGGGYAYAGKIRFSFTPSNIDLIGAELDIVNDQDEVLPIKLSPTKRSRYNDLYEADAYILRYDLDKSSIDFYEMFVSAFEGTYVWDEDIEDFVYEDVSNKETAYAYLGFLDSFGEMVNNFHDNGESDLNRMASEIYQFVRSSYTFQPSFQSIERCRLRFTFTVNGQERTVYSQNNLIATALKPLPISFCKDANWGEFLPNFLYSYNPFMVAEDDSGFKFLSEVKGLPTVMRKDNLKFYPTTNTMELYVPVARKHIAVTNVFKGDKSAQDGDADCIAKLKAANSSENLNTVFDSLKRMIEVGGMQIGYTYEIAYSILDFEGNISTKKYYMRIR